MKPIVPAVICAIAVMVVTVGPALPANAALKIIFDENMHDVDFLIPDNSLDDLDSLEGVITATFLAPSYQVDVTATSKPASGSASAPSLNVDIEVATSGVGTMNLALTDTDFTALPELHINFSGFTGGTVEHEVLWDDGNAEFAGKPLSRLGPLGPGKFGESASAGPFGTIMEPFSLTNRVVMNFTGGPNQQSRAQATLQAVPAPSAWLLFGTGMVGLGIWRWARRM